MSKLSHLGGLAAVGVVATLAACGPREDKAATEATPETGAPAADMTAPPPTTTPPPADAVGAAETAPGTTPAPGEPVPPAPGAPGAAPGAGAPPPTGTTTPQ